MIDTDIYTNGKRRRGKGKQTIAVLVEEAESFLELRDLIVSQLIRH